MTENRNIIKGNRHLEPRPVRNKSFYAIIDVKFKDKEGNTVVKSQVHKGFGTRIQVKNELYELATKLGGKVTYFGGFNK